MQPPRSQVEMRLIVCRSIECVAIFGADGDPRSRRRTDPRASSGEGPEPGGTWPSRGSAPDLRLQPRARRPEPNDHSALQDRSSFGNERQRAARWARNQGLSKPAGCASRPCELAISFEPFVAAGIESLRPGRSSLARLQLEAARRVPEPGDPPHTEGGSDPDRVVAASLQRTEAALLAWISPAGTKSAAA